MEAAAPTKENRWFTGSFTVPKLGREAKNIKQSLETKIVLTRLREK
jgi:hypothetical protein